MSDERDNIEEFFKARLSQREFPFDEDHWKDLERRLDAEAAAGDQPPEGGPSRFKNGWGYLLLLALAFIAGWYAGQTGNTTAGIRPELTTDRNAREEVATEEAIGSDEPAEAMSDDREASITIAEDEQPGKPAGQRGLAAGLPAEVGAQKEGTRHVAMIGSGTRSPWLIQRLNASDSLYPGRPSLHLTSLTKEETTLVADYVPGRWAFAVFVAPDFNSTRLGALFDDLGEAAGISADYYATPRIKLSAGFLFNNKRYGAPKEDYTMAAPYWNYYSVAPDHTDAVCFMYDIPVGIGYLLTRPSALTQLWINGGFSSYWLMSEVYEYTYEDPDPGQLREWSNKPRAFSFFSALNVAVTYQRALTPHFSVMVEPYFKVPVKGLGYGSVELLSGGVNLGLKYRPGRVVGRSVKAPPD